MSISPIITAKGQDDGFVLRVLAGDGHDKAIMVTLVANADAAATSLVIKPDHPTLASGDKLLFGEDTVITLSSGCSAGSKTLVVSAIPCALNTGDVLSKIQDLTSFTTIEMEVLANRGDETPIIAASSFTAAIATQTGDDRGNVTFTWLAAVTAAQPVGNYYFMPWRRDSGQKRPLLPFGDGGSFKIIAAGFLP